MKQKSQKLKIYRAENMNFFRPDIFKKNNGFTLIELMVALVIFVSIAGIMIANFGGLRASRNLKIAQTELVSNLRKIQSYALSSRALASEIPVQYYLMKFDSQQPDRYQIQAIYDVDISPKLASDVETIKLPQGITWAASNPLQLDRPPLGGMADFYDMPPSSETCVLYALRLPFAKSIMNRGCSFNNFSSDDYAKIKDFIVNSTTNSASSDTVLTITLSVQNSSQTKTVIVNGVTGAVTFN